MKDSHNDMREVIIDAARGIFSRFGFKKTTMDETAEAAYKAKSSIYHYFESKDEIYKSVIEKESTVLKEELIKAVSNVDDPQEKLRVYILTRMNVLNRLLNFHQALKEDYLKHLSFIEQIRGKYYRDEVRMIGNILNEGKKKGIFIIKDVEITAQAIIIALKGFEFPLMIEDNNIDTEKKLDNLLEILFYGIVTV